ncbi:alanine racemase [Verrucomicrobia bacterium]|nr:alanine racemase [Verrucomicrobiota bacterium]
MKWIWIVCKTSSHGYVIAWGVRLTVSSTREILRIQEAAGKRNGLAFLHLKIDTGMGRLGFSTNLIEEILTVLRQSPMIQIKNANCHPYIRLMPYHNRSLPPLPVEFRESIALCVLPDFLRIPSDYW